MERMNVALNDIKWPNLCACCGDVASSYATVSCTQVKEFMYFVVHTHISTENIVLEHPVCSKHKLYSNITNKLASRNMINLGLGFLAFILPLSYLVNLFIFIFDTPSRDFGFSSGVVIFFHIIFPLIFWIIFYYVRGNSPILVYKFENGNVELSFSNEKFSKHFKVLNCVGL